VLAANSSHTYGEIMPTATDRLIEHLHLRKDDVFYDLGSGVGKVVLHVALRAPIRRVVGVELARRRHRIARRMLDEVRATGLLRAQECELRCADFMRAPLHDATVIYTCSTAFSTPFMNELCARLARLTTGLRWVSTQDVDENPWFQLEDVLRLDMSWRRRSKVHVYRLERSRR
jgi:SAM-dependent methyltransferase